MDLIREKIIQLFCESLQMEDIPTDKSYFVLGGQSLSAAILVSKIEETFEIKISFSDFMQNASIDEFSKVVERICLK